jgi:monofunctional biosynthetic peptidoglycan transglycosylase
MLPGPKVAYNPYGSMSRVLKRSDMILGLLRKKGVLTEEEYRRALAEEPNITGLQRKVDESIKKEEVLANLSSATIPTPLPVKPGEDDSSTIPTTPTPDRGSVPDKKGEPEAIQSSAGEKKN